MPAGEANKKGGPGKGTHQSATLMGPKDRPLLLLPAGAGMGTSPMPSILSALPQVGRHR